MLGNSVCNSLSEDFCFTHLISFIKELTPWTRVLPLKLTDPQLVKKLPHFIEPEGSLPHAQAPTTCPYLKPV